MRNIPLKEKLKLIYESDFVPEQKQITDLVKLLIENTHLFIRKELNTEHGSVAHTAYLGEDNNTVTITVHAQINNPIELIINGEYINTTPCQDLITDLYLSINNDFRTPRERNINLTKAINILLQD